MTAQTSAQLNASFHITTSAITHWYYSCKVLKFHYCISTLYRRTKFNVPLFIALCWASVIALKFITKYLRLGQIVPTYLQKKKKKLTMQSPYCYGELISCSQLHLLKYVLTCTTHSSDSLVIVLKTQLITI